MGVLQSYGAFLVRHPSKLLLVSTLGVTLLFALSLWLRPLQSFSDPLIGFEARGTQLGARINTWRLLSEELSASANNISLVPNWPRFDGGYSGQNNWYRFDGGISGDPTSLGGVQQQDPSQQGGDLDPEPPIVESSIQQQEGGARAGNESSASGLDDGEEDFFKSISNAGPSANQNVPPLLLHHSLGSPKAFCGKLYEGYAQAVVAPSPTYLAHGLFNLDSLLAICQLDRRLRLEHSGREAHLFQEVCEQYKSENKSAETTLPLGATTCCNSWSLPNYIACLNERPTCMDITSKDLRHFEQLLDLCIPHYLRVPYEECFREPPEASGGGGGAQPAAATTLVNFLNSNLPGTEQKSLCGVIPSECLKCGGWTFNVLYYLTSENFLRHKPQALAAGAHEVAPPSSRTRTPSRLNPIGAPKEINMNKLTHSNIFLPMAKSASLMNYYLALSTQTLKSPYAHVKVLNLGLKNSLFEHLISDDIRLFVIALVSILVVISIYTWSFILSLVILLIICLSLCLSYAIYALVLNITIFPFMNLLAMVISFGICSDNAMLFCRHWTLSKSQLTTTNNADEASKSGNNEEQQQLQQQQQQQQPQQRPAVSQDLLDHASLDLMLRRAILSTSAATLATACSFVISAISQVTAVRCFCIFATLSVITNYLLTILLLPPALILDAKFHNLLAIKLASDKDARLGKLSRRTQAIRARVLELGDYIHMRLIFVFIRRFKFYLIITFVTLLICSSILVFHGPTLQPADDDVQLLSRKHAFEQYDKNLRRQFAFERAKQGELVGSSASSGKLIGQNGGGPETLPIRVVFGLHPQDNGDRFDQQDRGTLKFDPHFDLAEPNSQIWLLEFCQKLRNQRFVHPSAVTDMSNCFMDTFKSWMETRKCRDTLQPELDRSPCCQTSEFPFSRYTFNKCMLEVVGIMRRSPHLYPNLNAGIRFHKNSTRIAALIVEYQSNRIYTESFTKMARFYEEINDWVSWNIDNTAPPSMKSGWFISDDMDLLALQLELEQSTNVSVLLEVVFAMVALLISTRDIFLTLAGTFTIFTIITVILAILVLLKWTLGVAESILISLTIGLSIDFALHYTVAYSEGIRTRQSHGVIERILNEVGSPIALATATTTLAGLVIVWSDILAYQELGTFLMLIALVSWLSSTLFLLPILATFDSVRELSEQYARLLLLRAHKMLIDRL